MFDDPANALIWIPKIILTAQAYATAITQVEQFIIEEQQSISETYTRAMYFYVDLFHHPNEYRDYDNYSWIPLNYSEVTMLGIYANTLETIFKNKVKVFENMQYLIYIN